ncbi:hypothetical protein Nepgr_010429 [Nepenthes gracilis]|uniref:Uncharacterized protein n=1 Tax=Nepenthes gracilis TaxID=150966 RepID=A0AAD3SCX3_NEPGR|nr:hypothetical protein Nepgr_010429 [Nepenthes gracilis]
MAALYLTTMLLVLPVDGVGVGYYWALFGRALRLEMENATHGMEDSLPVLVLLRRIEMALYATLSAGLSLDFSSTASEATGGVGCSSVLACQDGAPPNLAGSPAGRPNHLPDCMPESGSVDPQLFPPTEVVHCSPVGVSSELHQLHGISGPCLVDGSRISSEPGSSPPTWASVVEKKAFGGGPGFVDRLSDLPMVHVDIVHSDVSSHAAAALIGME